MLEYNAERHEYRWKGDIVPHVTQALAPLTDYSHIPPAVLETARQKGVAVHSMVELHAKRDLDEDALPDWMRPVLAQWCKFVAETGFQMFCSEYRVYHSTYRYAGTLDLYGLLRDEPAFIDVKRSFLAGGVIGLQLAGYEKAYFDQHKNRSLKNPKRYALKLNESAPYRLEPFDSKSDFQDFLTCLSFMRLKEKYGHH